MFVRIATVQELFTEDVKLIFPYMDGTLKEVSRAKGTVRNISSHISRGYKMEGQDYGQSIFNGLYKEVHGGKKHYSFYIEAWTDFETNFYIRYEGVIR
jgi:hypothetical protein